MQRIALFMLLLALLAGVALGKAPEKAVRHGAIVEVQDADSLSVVVLADSEKINAWAGLFDPKDVKAGAKTTVIYVDQWVVLSIDGKAAEFK